MEKDSLKFYIDTEELTKTVLEGFPLEKSWRTISLLDNLKDPLKELLRLIPGSSLVQLTCLGAQYSEKGDLIQVALNRHKGFTRDRSLVATITVFKDWCGTFTGQVEYRDMQSNLTRGLISMNSVFKTNKIKPRYFELFYENNKWAESFKKQVKELIKKSDICICEGLFIIKKSEAFNFKDFVLTPLGVTRFGKGLYMTPQTISENKGVHGRELKRLLSLEYPEFETEDDLLFEKGLGEEALQAKLVMYSMSKK